MFTPVLPELNIVLSGETINFFYVNNRFDS